MLDKMAYAIEQDLHRLGIVADVQGYGPDQDDLRIYFVITFDTVEDMHLYKMLGMYSDNGKLEFRVANG